MTDKEKIMIDGVDVKGCTHRFWPTFGLGSCCRLYYTTSGSELLCADNPNCYFKQLTRKTQECEELKKQLQSDKGLITSAGKMNYQLLQEYDKLKNCLTEIKGIAEENVRIVDLEGLNGVYRRGLAKQILQKISECKVNND